jgi:hypothetical protein
MANKVCYKCNKNKPLTNFHKDCTRKDGYFPACKQCRADYAKRYRRQHPEIEFNRWLRRYNLSYKEYVKLKEQQPNKCAICGISFNNIDNKKVHVDHCHKKGKTRSILCQYCNHLLGNAKDDIYILESAIKYLNRYKGGY